MPRPRPLPAHVRLVPNEHPQLDAEFMKIVREICPSEDVRTPVEVRQDEYDAYLAVLDLLPHHQRPGQEGPGAWGYSLTSKSCIPALHLLDRLGKGLLGPLRAACSQASGCLGEQVTLSDEVLSGLVACC